MAAPFDRPGRSEGSLSSGFLAPVPADPRPTGLTYEPFYGLREKPFSLTSDSRFFYQSRSHAPAFDDLLNAIRRRESLNVLTGDIGTGKTTLCRAVLQSLDRKTFSAFVPDPFASREELLKVLLTDFGVASIDDVTSGRLRNATRTELSYLLYEFLGTLAPLQAFAVAIIDEAQNLSQQLLEEVRILSDADGQLQVVLVGQLELRDRLREPEMRQLEQRVSVHCQLQPLDIAGVAGYISHRLHVAGGSSDRVRFTGEAVEALYLLSGGVPRVINRLCDRALRYGYSKREATIDADIVQASSPEPEREQPVVPVPAAPPSVVVSTPIAVAPQPQAPPAPLPVSVAPPLPAPVAPPVAAPPVPLAAAPARAAADEDPPAAAPPEPPRTTAPTVPAGSPGQRAPLPDHLEAWLKEIDKQPVVDLDWRQRWAPTNAIAEPQPERRSGVRLRIPASQPQRYTHVDRMRHRLVRRFFWGGIALVLLLGALVLGPASVAASLDLVSEINEQLTPPPAPELPAPPKRPAPIWPHVTLPLEPL